MRINFTVSLHLLKAGIAKKNQIYFGVNILDYTFAKQERENVFLFFRSDTKRQYDSKFSYDMVVARDRKYREQHCYVSDEVENIA